MNEALRQFLQHIIDYAGLFPPAQLPLGPAIENYARYRLEAQSWMLARFIAPVREFDNLRQHGDLFEVKPPFVFSALLRGGDDANSFIQRLREDLAAIFEFVATSHGQVVVDRLEARLSQQWLDRLPPEELTAFFGEVRGAIQESTTAIQIPYFEVPLSGDWRSRIAKVSGALADYNQQAGDEAGLKLRCGGEQADMVPGATQVATFIAACRDAGIPMKCTAGLHHPIRHFDDDLQTKVHGFFNVFGAGVLAHAAQLETETIQRIVEDEDASHFRFDNYAFRWGDFVADLDAIAEARTMLITSFGSCSFDEPVDDLRAMELIA